MSASRSSSVLVVGAGIIGLAAAWQLAEQGHRVWLIDPALHAAGAAQEPEERRSGSGAALGVLMARVFHRSSGRAWRLRQRSHELWQQWLPQLEQRGHRLSHRAGLLLLASTDEELAKQARLLADERRLGLGLQQLGPAEIEALHPQLPGRPLGGLLSTQDGQLDPGPLLAALLQEAIRAGVACCADRAVGLERARQWRLTLAGGQRLEARWLVLALGPDTSELLAGLGHDLPLEPVLGQALELELADDPGWSWPGAVIWRGVNLVPRPDLSGGRRLWLGATLEPGEAANPKALLSLRDLGGDAPGWLQSAVEVRRWHGWRAQPRGRPAPVLLEAEPGLLVASGHYRNGVLLAPASAAWLCERINGTRTSKPQGEAAEEQAPPGAGS